LDVSPPSTLVRDGVLYIPDPETLIKHDIPIQSTSSTFNSNNNNNTSTDSSSSKGVDPNITSQPPIQTSQDQSQEITAKLHLVSPDTTSSSIDSIAQSLDILSKYKGLPYINNLLIGFRNIDYRGRKTDTNTNTDCNGSTSTSELGSKSEEREITKQQEDDVLSIWRGLGSLSNEVQVENYGTLYLPLGLLRRLSDLEKEGGKRVGINALDTPDCHHLPKEYTDFAKERGIELWAGGGGEGSGEFPIINLTDDSGLRYVLKEVG